MARVVTFDVAEAILHQMPLALLHLLSKEFLPVAVTDGGDIDSVRLLVLAGHVRADVPKPVRTLNGYHQPPATVTEITSLGRQMIKRFPPAKQR